MDHNEAIQLMIAEKYLLDELSLEARDQFEEHFFGCTECALDLRAGATLVEQMKTVLSEAPPRDQVRLPAPLPTKSGWMVWLRPAFVLPVLGVLVVLVGYQNLVIYPQLKLAANTPQVLPWASINVSTRGTNAPVVTTHPGEGFLLFVNIPPDSRYSSYIADLRDVAGKTEWSLTMPAVSAEDTWPIRVPATTHQAGTYTLLVQGVSAAGKRSEVGRSQFELHIQK